MKAGMIGLGAMGAPIARNLAKAGYLTAVWNRTRACGQALADELNVACSGSTAELAQTCDVVLICVSADQDVLAIVHGIRDSLKPDSTVVDLSTVSSDTARQAADILNQQSVHFLDAPVSGGVEGARNATLAMMIGGDGEVLKAIQPILTTIAARIVHMGPTGSGQGTKAVNQLMAAGINQAVTDALAFAQAQGLNTAKLIEVLSAGAAGNWFLEHRGLSMTQDQFDPGFKLALHYKDLKICEAMCQRLGFQPPTLPATLRNYQQLIQAGYGNEDISALYRLKAIKSACNLKDD